MYECILCFEELLLLGACWPSKKVLNSQRLRPAKPLGPRALRIPPSIPDLQNYSGVSNSFSSSPSPLNSPSTPSYSSYFLLVQPSLCLNPSETRRQTFQSPRKYCYALLFSFFFPRLTDRLVSSTVRLKTHPQTTPLSLLMPNSLESLASKKVKHFYLEAFTLRPLSSSAIPPSPPRFFFHS